MNTRKGDPAHATHGVRPDPPRGLSERDRHNLAGLETKLQLVRDFTGQVAGGLTTGLYLFGEGGIGKSHTVLDELGRLKADHKVFNSRMTGRGLYNALERFPDSVHVLEDMEQITRDRGAQGVLRSALWGQRKDGGRGPMERTVTWSTFKMEHSFVFTGGIIMIANKPLGDLPELQALKTRITCFQLRATDAELTALMRSVAGEGYTHEGQELSPDECSEVCEFLVAQSRSLHRTVDMRLLVNGFMDYLAWRECDAGCHWNDLVATRLKERPTTFGVRPNLGTRAERLQREREIAREIAGATGDRQERFRLWKEKTGKAESTLYRHLKEIGGGSFSDSQDAPN